MYNIDIINIVNSTTEISFNKAQYGLPGRVVCVANYMYQHKDSSGEITYNVKSYIQCKEYTKCNYTSHLH